MHKNLLSVISVIKKIWTPLPKKTESTIPLRGGRNTSPWTNFQPNSSWASSYQIIQYKSPDYLNTSESPT